MKRRLYLLFGDQRDRGHGVGGVRCAGGAERRRCTGGCGPGRNGRWSTAWASLCRTTHCRWNSRSSAIQHQSRPYMTWDAQYTKRMTAMCMGGQIPVSVLTKTLAPSAECLRKLVGIRRWK